MSSLPLTFAAPLGGDAMGAESPPMGGTMGGEMDWTFLDDGLDAARVARGVTTGIARPPGGGNFVYGFNSLSTDQGAVALFANLPDFAPMQKGGSVRGAIQRGVSGGRLRFAPFLFVGLQGSSVNDSGYFLGLGDGDPHHIVLGKGALANGLADVAPGTNGVLRRSTAIFEPGSWLHLRLDMVVNQNGDVLLQVFHNDLIAHPLSSPPNWVTVQGMDEFVDDALGVNSGTQPFTSGRGGFGFFTKDVARRGSFDQVEVYRQL
jgi:hypothetical protein